MKRRLPFEFFMGLLWCMFCLVACQSKPDRGHDWPEYHGDGERSHYSELQQIDQTNVTRLQVAWQYASGGADTTGSRSQMQCNPIMVDGILYGVSADIQAFAIDAATGLALWKSDLEGTEGTLSRGVTYWSDGKAKRIFFGAGRWLHALDATTGVLISTFGTDGRIDLRDGIRRPGADDFISSNTPNTVYKDLIIVSGRVAETETALLGDIRAYNIRTGALVWTFKTIPEPDQPGYETWDPGEPRKRLGGANTWMGMAIDRELGIVYAPTGSAAFDFWGGNRLGDNLYSNCLLALDASTGRLLWHYQLVRHDIWDRDPPTTPNLVTISRGGRKIKAVALVTKQGYTFVFDRVTGEPVYPIEQVSFPYDAMDGEQPARTQPVPVLPQHFTRQQFTAADFRSFLMDGRDSLERLLADARTGSPYIPITDKMTVFFPGTDGGAQWGGAATDPSGILYVPAKEVPVYTTLKPRADRAMPKGVMGGQKLFNIYCASCHGEDRKGNHDGSFPTLIDLDKKMSVTEVGQLLTSGRGMMPPFGHLSADERKAIVEYVLVKEPTTVAQVTRKSEVPYQNTGYNRWYHDGYPVNSPPWGTLTAIDLNTGKRRWQVVLGEYQELSLQGVPPTGTDNYGGPVATAGGLVFIAATRDEKIRAFDKDTGALLWEHALPAAGYATPSTYMINGKQYIVIACGGGKLNTKSGDKYVAFALMD